MLAKAKHAVSAYQRETVPFLGLNRSDDTREGEFSAQKNMSDRRYPFLAPRLPRAKETYTEPTALFAWNGKEIRAEGGILYYDGEALCNVLDGPKQFAVVNTKLVVWPDKIAVDLTDGTAGAMFFTATNKGAATFTANSMTFELRTPYSQTQGLISYSGGSYPYAWTYSSVSWTQDGGWTLEGGEITDLYHDTINGRYFIPTVTKSGTTSGYVIGSQPADITWFTSKPSASTFPESEPANNLGFYALGTSKIGGESTVSSGRFYQNIDIYWAQQENQSLSEIFSAGDVVTVSNTPYGLLDGSGLVVSSANDTTRRLTFNSNVFPVCDAVYKRTASTAYSVQAFQYEDEDGDMARMYWRASDVFELEPGQIIGYFADTNTLRVYASETDFKSGMALKTITPTKTTESMKDYNYVTGIPLSYTTYAVSVTRGGPALDYICEHENRLWGVSNEDKTIYASALGDPNNFYDYTGESGSYTVAVGSEGDFTGICSYGNAVLCWKERTLHKVLGDYPSNYQTAVYRFAGVRAGAHKSLVNVNETLFFLGVDGVYAYTGNKPSLISRALGASVLKDGVGGTDGKAYYLSAKNGEAWELLSYDTHTGLWTRSDKTQVVDFCRVGDDVKFLSGDSVYTIGSGDEAVEWEAVFVPMYETLEGGKQYNRLIFRVEVPKDGWLAADVRFDDGRWIQVGIVKGKSGPVHMPVPLRRCDKFQIRLRGKGDCAVLDMVREFRLRGDR